MRRTARGGIPPSPVLLSWPISLFLAVQEQMLPTVKDPRCSILNTVARDFLAARKPYCGDFLGTAYKGSVGICKGF